MKSCKAAGSSAEEMLISFNAIPLTSFLHAI